MTNLQRIIIILAAFGAVSIVLSQTGSNGGDHLATSVPVANIHINSQGVSQSAVSGNTPVSIKSSSDLIDTNQNPSTIVTNIYQSGSGSFYFQKEPPVHDSPADYIPEFEVSTKLSTHADIKITGPIARTKLTQVFSNTSKTQRSGVFVFPLPQDAAVDHLLMTIGDRKIEGVIKPKNTAKKMFVKAKAQGKKASLVEQLRPNMFTNHIANIPPNSSISVTIEYQQFIVQDQHQYSLRLPLSITPRYFVKNGLANNDLATHDSNTALASLTANTSISVSLNAGIPIRTITSEHHPIVTTNPYSTEYRIELDTQLPINKDFVLNWQLAAAQNIQASHFTYENNEYEYGLISLMPPKMDTINPKRNVVFILDVSGSMVGDALLQAKKSLALAIQDLQDDDYFNLVTFSSDAKKLWHESEMATPAFKDEALAYLYELDANGGTEIQKALNLAFALPTVTSDTETYLNQILFITDGSVGNENELMQTIYQNLGDYRLFTVGIGSAPNAYFMSEAAQAGKGSFTFIGDISHVQSKMGRLLEKLKRPALTNIELNIKDARQAFGFEIYPSKIPDLYADEPLIITYRRKLDDIYKQRSINMPFKIKGKYLAPTAQGKLSNREWSSQLPKVSAKQERGIHKHWARLKIKELSQQLSMRSHFSEGYDTIKKNIEDGITKVALTHNLVSQFTSLIAIDYLDHADIKAMQLAKHQSQQTKRFTQSRLPSTATPAGLLALIGSLLLFLSLLLLKRSGSKPKC